MAAVKLDIDNINTNPNSQIIIAIPGVPRPVTGYIQNDVFISAGNEFNTPFENQAQNSLNTKLQGLGSVTGRFSDTAGEKLKTFSLKTIDQSALFWTGSRIPQFSIPLTFVAVRESDDVRDPVENLYKTVFPIFDKLSKSATIRPPLGYFPKGISADGTISVRIGNWFNASRLVMVNVDFSFSREVIESGAPLFATGTVVMRPFRAISFNEFQGWLRGRGTSGGTG